ncbi:aldo/keto reductase [Saccharothrix australiensis]|uniref:Diketogulonate reductase-like aldo/keto reductase n=1 Tax=Saccharothrix australiensis TaxID=2072 RepID=A0A495VZV1_9PSEU|nr:aldo/keto reductase [Saccharothrix australiensis]RKT54053.1 diketogulonate reductase-like aldo/keto reductase [Saccharothrix australiensis]
MTTTITLNNGVTMPQLGFGVFQVSTEDTEAAVSEALRVGYRSIDTAAAYGNEEPVGRALAASGVARDELFVTTKLWNTDQGYDEALRAFDTSIGKLGLDRVDLYLIHWPAAVRDRYVDSWRALGKLLGDGRVRAIGVSNFQKPHLERVIEETGMVPAVNQIELHPRLQQRELRAFHAERGIATEAWSPLAQGGELLRNEVLTAIADKHGRTPAQVVLRWHLQLGNVVIPKSVTPSRIAENFAVFDFALDEEDLDRIAGLDTGERTGPHPDEFN